MKGPQFNCATPGCGGLAWRDGSWCRVCQRNRLAVLEIDKQRNPESLTDYRRRINRDQPR